MCKKHKKEPKQMDRRSFLLDSLKGVGAGVMLASPLEIFLGNVLMGVFQRAEAASLGNESFFDKKFVNLTMSGGPSRWFWDLPLRPNGNDEFHYNKEQDPKKSMLITKLSSGTGPGGFVGSYETIKVGDFYLPYLWASKIPTADGGSVPMTNLAQNMLMMRGIDMLIDSHELDRVKALVPTPGGSLLGLVADAARTVLPAINVNDEGQRGDYYNSRAGIPFQDMNGTNPFTTAFAPFTNPPAGSRSISGAASTGIEGALDIMKKNAGDKHRYLPSTYQDRINARRLLLTQFNNLQGTFTTLKTKYEGLIKRSMSDTSLWLAGVEDKPIPSDKSSVNFRLHSGDKGIRYDGDDLRSITTANSLITDLADGMAVAEYMIGGDLSMSTPQSFSSSLHILIGSINGFFDESTDLNNGSFRTGRGIGLQTDAHGTGSYVQLIQFTRYFRAVSACLYEFVRQLKLRQVGSGTLFDNTVISVTAEFSRDPKDGNPGGADHGFEGSCYTILSGMIPKLMVAGNITANANSNKGTWGVAAPMQEFSGQTGLIGNAASTVAELLEFKTPTPNNPSYVYKDASGKAVMKVGKPENKG